MSVKRRDVVRYLEQNGFYLKREGKRHSFYAHPDGRAVAVKHHTIFDRISANEVCKDVAHEMMLAYQEDGMKIPHPSLIVKPILLAIDDEMIEMGIPAEEELIAEERIFILS